MKNLMNNKKGVLIAMLIMFFTVQVNFAQSSRETKNVKDFHELSVSHAFKVELKVGNTESLEIEIEDRYADDVITEVKGGRLVIKMRSSGSKRYRMNDTPVAYLTVKSLDAIYGSGAISIRSSDVLKSENMDINLSGASNLILELDVEKLYLETSGACVMTLEGKAREQIVKISGATTYKAFDLESEIGDIRVGGASSARISVSEKLDVRASGASSVRYKGRPSLNSDSSGASSVRSSN
jgi:Putative auto-transporter adhesin, head GIN domain